MNARGAIFATVAISTFFFAPVAFAQSLSDISSNLSSNGGPPPITLSLSSQYPAPYSSVTLTTNSTTLNLANATLAVSVNGAKVYVGNVQPVAITTGAPGTSTTINATVTSQGESYAASVTITPGDVSLVEEPVASAPPLYLGKPLVPISGEVRLVAMTGFRTASGVPIDPSTLSYTWTQDGSTLEDVSGIGKSVIIVDSPLQYRSSSISVVVEAQDGTEVGADSVSLAPQDPTVRIYADDPLLGILFDHALSSSFAITGTEASFYAAPYSFSIANEAPTIAWFLNGSGAGSENSITLRPTGGGAGNGSLSVSASENANYESATADLSLSFGSNANTNLFGL